VLVDVFGLGTLEVGLDPPQPAAMTAAAMRIHSVSVFIVLGRQALPWVT
jgi:hypothetical protein